jgi:transposase
MKVSEPVGVHRLSRRCQYPAITTTPVTTGKHLDALFLFALVSDVEPTNNAAERALRHGVLWRKMSHGPKSVEGSEYMACIWSVAETCRQHGRGVWDFLTACMAVAAEGGIIPSLLTPPKNVHAA